MASIVELSKDSHDLLVSLTVTLCPAHNMLSSHVRSHQRKKHLSQQAMCQVQTLMNEE